MRRVLLALAFLSLLTGFWIGLYRLALPLSIPPRWFSAHGPLMISGFLGLVITLERAMGFQTFYAFIPPVFCGAGVLSFLAGVPWFWWAGFFTLGSISFTCFLMSRIMSSVGQRTLFSLAMGGGALLWAVGNLFWWLGHAPVAYVLPWWVGFPVFIIAGERLELAWVLKPISKTGRVLFAVLLIFLFSSFVTSSFSYTLGTRLSGGGLIGLALWFLNFDPSRKIRGPAGFSRYMASTLHAGYLWLGGGGVLWLIFGGVVGGPRYDAVLHSIFLGFVFGMIFAHAPLILPSVFGVPFRFSSLLYLPWILFQFSLLWRLLGDLHNWVGGRQEGGSANVLCLLLFFATLGYLLWKGNREGDAKTLSS